MFIFVLVTAVAAGNFANAQTVTAADISEIILETGDGFCAHCERITTLRGDGSATFHGGKNSRVRKGNFSGDIGKAEFARLAKTIVEAGFFNFKPRYEGKTSDVATVEITVVYSGGRKTVKNFKRSDEPKLKVVEQAFNATADRIKWRNNDAKAENQPVAKTDSFAHLKKAHAAVIKSYIGTRKNLRPALETDGENQTGLELMREAYGADYQPYYAVYDFDKDNIEDFAVVLFDAKAKSEARFSLIVFKGAADKTFKPAFNLPRIDLSFGGLELEILEEGVVELRLVHFQTEQGCSLLSWNSRKLVLEECVKRDY